MVSRSGRAERYRAVGDAAEEDAWLADCRSSAKMGASQNGGKVNQLPAGLALLSLVSQSLPSATTGCRQEWSGPSDPLPLLVFDRSFSLCQNSAYLFRVSLTMMLPPSLGCPLGLKTPKMETPG